MEYFNWNNDKNEWLKRNRGISFEEIVLLISEGSFIEIVENRNKKYNDQFLYIILYHDYIYLVPFVKNDEEIFLKTIIPSRKATRKYLKGR